jgi:hypothetical protein
VRTCVYVCVSVYMCVCLCVCVCVCVCVFLRAHLALCGGLEQIGEGLFPVALHELFMCFTGLGDDLVPTSAKHALICSE